MKFMVGDKAIVKKDLEDGKQYGIDCFYEDPMGSLKGKTVTIARVASNTYRLKEMESFNWTDEMLEPITLFASTLMDLARANPAAYEGKRYRVIDDDAVWAVKDLKPEFYPVVTFGTSGNMVGEKSTGSCYMVAIYSNTQLEEIPAETKVPFMEAVKAHSEGKTIKSKIGEVIHVYRGYSHSAMVDENCRTITKHEILNGDWYIIG